MVREGDYGWVRATKGPHIGKVGVYDDDESVLAIVYFGKWDQGYQLIPRSSLIKAEGGDTSAFLFESAPSAPKGGDAKMKPGKGSKGGGGGKGGGGKGGKPC